MYKGIKGLPFRLFFVSILLSIAPCIFSQPAISWNTVPATDPLYIPTNNVGRSIVNTPDGGYIVCGNILLTTNTDPDINKRSYDAWVVKYDRNGTIEWKKNYGGSKEDAAMSIVNASDGGFVFAGFTNSNDGDVSGNMHYNGFFSEVWVVKIRSNGDIEWQKCFGGSSTDRANGITASGDGGYVFAGYTYSGDGDVQGLHAGLATSDFWVVKIDASGKLIWQKCIGGSHNDEANAISAAAGGGFLMTGISGSNDGDVSGNHGLVDMLTVRISTTGAIEWIKSLGGSRGDIGNSIVATPDGGAVICGESSSTDGDATSNHSGNGNLADVWVVKLNNTGNIQWQKSLGGSEFDIGYSIQNIPSAAGGYVLAAYTYSSDKDVSGNHSNFRDAWIVKLDQAGLLEWQRCYGGIGDEIAYAVLANSDNTFVFTGYTTSSDGDVSNNPPQGGAQTWTVKLGGCGAPVVISEPIDQTTTTGSNVSFKVAVNGSAPLTYQWYLNGNAIQGATSQVYTITSVSLAENGSLYHCVITNCSGTKSTESRKALLAVKSSADCEENYFIKTYIDDASSAYPSDMEQTASKDVIVCGEIRKGVGGETDGFIFRIDRNGKKLWELSLVKAGSQAFRKLTPLKDGHFLAAGYDAPDINSLTYFILKFDDQGHVLWRKDFRFTSTQERMGIQGMREAPDGSIIMVAYWLENHLSFNDRMLYFKFDATGNLVLSQSFGPDYPISVLAANDLIIKDGYSYIVGNHNYNEAGGLRGFLSKIDNADGRLLWTRTYDSNGGEENFLRIFDYGVTRLLILGQSDLNASDTSTLMICDTSGALQSTRYFRYGLYRQFGGAALDSSGNLLYANYHTSGGPVDLAMCMVNPVNGLLWAKHFPQISTWPQVTKILLTSDGNIFCSGYKYGINAADGIKLYIGKWSSSGEIGCVPEPLTVQFGHTISSLHQRTLIRKATTFLTANRPVPSQENLIHEDQTLCLQASTCSVLKISGNGKVCRLVDTLTLDIFKNETCLSQVKFKFDTTYFSLIDFPVKKVRFKVKKAGTSTITAQMDNSCYPVSDSMAITVYDVPAQVHLGEDKMLCAGNTLLLNAGSGFATYKWQDNSFDSTIIVKAPGTFFVEAKDACGNSYNDTIVITAAPPITFSAGGDRIKCNKDTVQISATTGFLSYTWSPNYQINAVTGQNVVINPSVDTIYYVKAEKTPGCFAYDTIHISVRYSAPISLGNDTSFCQGNQLDLHAGPGFADYKWNTGATSEHITVNAKGTYYVTAIIADGCSSSDTLKVENVYPNPLIKLDASPGLCKGSTRTLDPGNFSRYLWQDGSTRQHFVVKDTGIYYVEVTDFHRCIGRDTVRMTTLLPSPSKFLFSDTAICSYGSLNLKTEQSYTQYLWSTSASSSSIKIQQPGLYWLQVTDQNNCIGRDTVNVRLKQCMSGLYVPNAFTPDLNGKNDVFRALLFGRVLYFEFTVYNRWGEVVFKTNDQNRSWNGYYKGKLQESSTFIWACSYQLEGEQKQFEKGTVMLVK